MTRVAITGHRDLTELTTPTVEAALRTMLEPHATQLVGISCLADGADQLFARIVLDLGGTLEAVILRSTGQPTAHAAELARREALLPCCVTVVQVECRVADGHAHMRAGIAMLARADVLLAVWDGLPGRGPGGTADTVAYARRIGMPVAVIWPDHARRRVPAQRLQPHRWVSAEPGITIARHPAARCTGQGHDGTNPTC